MADLPSSRLQISRPFSKSGVDYAGPFNTRAAKHRGSKTVKSYVAIFICKATKATHLELVSAYDAASFLAAFRLLVLLLVEDSVLSCTAINVLHSLERMRNYEECLRQVLVFSQKLIKPYL